MTGYFKIRAPAMHRHETFGRNIVNPAKDETEANIFVPSEM